MTRSDCCGGWKWATLLGEFARVHLKPLPKKGDLRDLNYWRGAVLLDAASKIIWAVINDRLSGF